MNIFKPIIFVAAIWILQFILSYAFYTFLDPTSFFDTDEANILTLNIANQLFAILSFLIGIILYSLTTKGKSIKKNSTKSPTKILFIILLITLGFNTINHIFWDFSQILSTGKGRTVNIPIELVEYNLLDLPTLVSVILIIPILEELVFRRIIFTDLKNNYSLFISMIVSSILFSAMHLPNYSILLPTFIFGLIASYLYHSTKRILYPIIFHIFTNGLWILMTAQANKYYNWLYSPNYGYKYWAIALIGLLILATSLFVMRRIQIEESS